jgi:flagellar hook-associated protein 3 FlgL
VSNPAAYNGGTYAISFAAGGAYQVTQGATVVATGTYTDGGTIAFNGVQVTLSGQPATGDSFTLAPSTNQSLFTTVQNLVNALQTGISSPGSSAALSNSINSSINNIDQALNQTSNVRATIGGRLNSITTQQSVATSQQTQLQQSITNLQGLDYASAITTLDQQNTTLSAALQAFTMTQGLNLFKFL